MESAGLVDKSNEQYNGKTMGKILLKLVYTIPGRTEYHRQPGISETDLLGAAFSVTDEKLLEVKRPMDPAGMIQKSMSI